MNSFFFIDKPSGVTSFGVLRDMKRILSVKKIGHTGTLDPLATGGLLVATGNYTKLIPYFEKDKKSYRATIMLDGSSPSYDSDSEITYLSAHQQKSLGETLSRDDIKKCLNEFFAGEILQVPPKYSALKINGKRALDRTLAGEEVIMKERRATIIMSEIVFYKYPELIVNFTVGAGTYIRSIAYDLGIKLGAEGYLSALRRTGVGFLGEDMLVTLEKLSPETLLSPHDIFKGKIHTFTDTVVLKRLGDGQRVWGEFNLPENEEILLSDGHTILYVVEYKNSVLHPRKKIV